MSILDKAQIGNSVQVNLELSKDRLNKETVEAINFSPVGKISDFKITDGKGIGVILELSNGEEQWFFEDEIDLLDENGNVIRKIYDKKENNTLLISKQPLKKLRKELFDLISNKKQEFDLKDKLLE